MGPKTCPPLTLASVLKDLVDPPIQGRKHGGEARLIHIYYKGHSLSS